MAKIDQIDDTIYSYATLRQKEIIDAMREHGSQRKAAKAIGITKTGVVQALEGAIKRAVRQGYSPSHDLTKPTPSGVAFSGASTLYRLKGRDDDSVGTVMQWVKSNVALSDQVEAATHLIESLINDIKPLPMIPFNNQPQTKDRFTVIPIGDPHIGLLVWSKECGDSWDLEIAERVYTKVFKRLLSAMPDTEECVLVNTGDAFHADNAAGVSTRSGHSFDLDGRHGKWIDVGYMLMRMFTDLCLKKYKRVEFVNVPGNHDDILGRTIGSLIEHVYSNNPRVTVQKGNNPFQYVHKENVLLGFAHGHTCKLPSLPGKMADDMYKLWGNSTYRHWITGHVHHKSWIQFKEHPGCKVETVGIIPPKDAYAHGGGYGAGRGIQGLIFDKKIGYLPHRHEEIVRGDD